MSYSSRILSNNTDMQSVIDMINNLPDAGSGGVDLPDLTNPASAETIVDGYDAISEDGQRIVGTAEPAYALADTLVDQDSKIAELQTILAGKATVGTPEMCTVTLVNEMGEDAFDPYLTGYWFKENLTGKEMNLEALDYVDVVAFPEKVFTVPKNSVVVIEAQTMDKDDGIHTNNPLTVEGGAMLFSNGSFEDAYGSGQFDCRFYIVFGDCTITATAKS